MPATGNQWYTVEQISDNEIYLLIKYIKRILWRVAKRLSYTEDTWCLKDKLHFGFNSYFRPFMSKDWTILIKLIFVNIDPTIFRWIESYFVVCIFCFFFFSKELYPQNSHCCILFCGNDYISLPYPYIRFLYSTTHYHTPSLFIVRYFISFCLSSRQNLVRSGVPRLICLSCLCMTTDW